MKKQLFTIALSLLAAANSFAQDVKVMTYNLRLDTTSDGENQWGNRKEFVAGLVQFYEPDFMGVQEALPNQMEYLDTNLPAYDFIGVGREEGGKGEHSAIFYNKSKFKVLQQSTFWLSQTPDKPSKGWDAAYNRVCTYGLFENLKTRQKMWVFNTHLDHMGNTARMEGTKLVLQKIKELNKQNLPFVLTGDFNLEDTDVTIKQVETQLNDSKAVAKLVFGPSGTFNDFKFSKPVTERIDYIFVPKTGIMVNKYAVLSESKDCKYPSDHLPVYVELTVKK
jgi:endonuclease/exonuclease/phosphatase family metal-dependent hydrolase